MHCYSTIYMYKQLHLQYHPDAMYKAYLFETCSHAKPNTFTCTKAILGTLLHTCPNAFAFLVKHIYTLAVRCILAVLYCFIPTKVMLCSKLTGAFGKRDDLRTFRTRVRIPVCPIFLFLC